MRRDVTDAARDLLQCSSLQKGVIGPLRHVSNESGKAICLRDRPDEVVPSFVEILFPST